jgi:hypothetical protein
MKPAAKFFLERVADIFIRDHRYRSEISEWRQKGKFPDYVVRSYRNERLEHTDLLRMQALGYRVVRRQELFRTGRGIPVGMRLTYSRVLAPFD